MARLALTRRAHAPPPANAASTPPSFSRGTISRNGQGRKQLWTMIWCDAATLVAPATTTGRSILQGRSIGARMPPRRRGLFLPTLRIACLVSGINDTPSKETRNNAETEGDVFQVDFQVTKHQQDEKKPEKHYFYPIFQKQQQPKPVHRFQHSTRTRSNGKRASTFTLHPAVKSTGSFRTTPKSLKQSRRRLPVGSGTLFPKSGGALWRVCPPVWRSTSLWVARSMPKSRNAVPK